MLNTLSWFYSITDRTLPQEKNTGDKGGLESKTQKDKIPGTRGLKAAGRSVGAGRGEGMVENTEHICRLRDKMTTEGRLETWRANLMYLPHQPEVD